MKNNNMGNDLIKALWSVPFERGGVWWCGPKAVSLGETLTVSFID